MAKTIVVNFTSDELFNALQNNTVDDVVRTTDTPESIHQAIVYEIKSLNFAIDGNKSTVQLTQ